VFSSMGDPMDILCDNTAAIANTKVLRTHSIVKHILHHYHVMRDNVKDGKLRVFKVRTDLNLADPLMKPLPRAKFDPHHHSMGVRSLPNIN
jgi:hypothetical protein